MNVKDRRSVNNVLVRWVQRHQAMTTLFRAPGTHPARQLYQSAYKPVIQMQREDVPARGESRKASVASPPARAAPSHVARGIASAPSVLTDATLLVPRTTSAETSQSNSSSGRSEMPDPVWKRLQTIFRKHQEASESKRVSGQDETSPVVESTEIDSLPLIDHEGPPTYLDEGSSTRPNASAVRPPMTSTVSTKPIQRSMGTVENTSQTNNDLPKGEFEVHHQTLVINAQPQQQPIPLQNVWNVQRVETVELPSAETAESANAETINSSVSNFIPRVASKASKDSAHTVPSESKNTQVVSHEERELRIANRQRIDNPDSDSPLESHNPVEILTPSRPRPAHASVSSSNDEPAIQKKPENAQPSGIVAEPPLVDTAIGPLPSDLWQLLGQTPPSGTSSSEVHEETRTSLTREDIVNPQRISSAKKESAPEQKAPTTALPATIQRQTIANIPLSRNGQAGVLEPEETPEVEVDLDDLAHRVYAELRHRLSIEWERMRRR